ncbi:MAG: hypothetical protein OEX22_11705 [Cyclobacteriaceae bacterium]|nr:hypothetical protein [Cyclobacteriaceae bacterium]
MTGGVGFAGMGRSSNKNNLGMLGNRKSMGDNPYRGKKKKERRASNYDELKKFNKKKFIRMKNMRNTIFWSILIIISFTLFFVYLFTIM